MSHPHRLQLICGIRQNSNLPPSLVLQHGPLRIGVLHGRQVVPLGDAEALSAVARKMDVDILVSGGTHRYAQPCYQIICFPFVALTIGLRPPFAPQVRGV